ncbi:MAG: hypothetical protein ACREFP_17750 [Acetobacteraceae bacterium]
MRLTNRIPFKHNGVGARIYVKTDDIVQHGVEVRIAQALEATDTMSLQLVCLPDPLHRTQRGAERLSLAPAVQCVAARGGSVQFSVTTHATISAGSGGMPGLRDLSRNRPSTPCSAKRCRQRQTIGRFISIVIAARRAGSPPADCKIIRARCIYCATIVQFAAIRRNRYESPLIRSVHRHTYCLTHPDRVARNPTRVNPR